MKSEEMQYINIIAGITRVDGLDSVRAKANLKTVDEAVKSGFPVVIVDGGSPPDFCQALKEKGAYVYNQTEQGWGKAVRESFLRASRLAGDKGLIIWMELEKYSFVPKIPNLLRLMIKDKADFMMLGRTKKSLLSYPSEQMHEEYFMTLASRIFTSLKWDFVFGPFIANQKALSFFLEYKGDYGDIWDSIWIPRLRIFASGLKVKYAKVNYIHPFEQTKEETGNPNFVMKRLGQLNNLIPAYANESRLLGLRKK